MLCWGIVLLRGEGRTGVHRDRRRKGASFFFDKKDAEELFCRARSRKRGVDTGGPCSHRDSGDSATEPGQRGTEGLAQTVDTTRMGGMGRRARNTRRARGKEAPFVFFFLSSGGRVLLFVFSSAWDRGATRVVCVRGYRERSKGHAGEHKERKERATRRRRLFGARGKKQEQATGTATKGNGVVLGLAGFRRGAG